MHLRCGLGCLNNPGPQSPRPELAQSSRTTPLKHALEVPGQPRTLSLKTRWAKLYNLMAFEGTTFFPRHRDRHVRGKHRLAVET